MILVLSGGASGYWIKAGIRLAAVFSVHSDKEILKVEALLPYTHPAGLIWPSGIQD